MSLFTKEELFAHREFARHSSWTREIGTRKLVIGFLAVIALGFLALKAYDFYLLREKWTQLKPQIDGLTVVGTLDSRGSYERNMFQVVHLEGSARVELTKYGRESIFSEQNGKLFGSRTSKAIDSALTLDNATGFLMLEPFLRSGVSSLLNKRGDYDNISPDYKVLTEVPRTPIELMSKPPVYREKTLGELIDLYDQETANRSQKEGSDTGEGGGANEHSVEHGLVIPAETLGRTCPVVLVTRCFTGSNIIEHPADAFGAKSFTLELTLTPEGRSRFYQWSREHVNENLVFIANKKILAAARIKDIMDVSYWEITNLKDEQEVHELADAISRQKH